MVGDGYAPVAVIYGTPCREPAIGDLRAQFLRHSFLAWVLLPLSVCAWESWAPEQWRATCAQGYSLMSLLPLCVVELHYLYSEQCAWTSMKSLLSEPELVVLKHFGVLRHRKWLVLLGLFEVFILFTDVMFPFIARACDGILTEHWQTAWRSVPLVGPHMAELLNTIRFWGYALLATGAVILTNGVLGLVLCIPCAHEGQVTGDDFVAWARAAETSMMPSVASLAEEMAIQKRHLVDYKSPHHGQGEPGEGEVFGKLDGDAAIMFELFNQKLAAHIHFTESAHFLLLMLGKVLIGRCFQLWIQSSFLALAFHQEQAGAKDKVILGCCLGATLLVQRAIHSMRTLGCTGLPLLLAIILCVVWSGVKIALAFVCEDHLWNLTTGCVKLSHP